MRVARLAAAALTCALVVAGCAAGDTADPGAPAAARDAPSGVPDESPSSSGGINGLPGASGIPGIPGAAAPTPTADSTPLEPGQAAPALDLGVQVFAMWRDWETREALMDELVAAGSTWMRFDVGWCSLEERGSGDISSWYLARLDAVVDAAEERGISLLATLTCSPTWARTDGRTKALPDDPAEYGRVAEYLADRYRGRIAAWELWNEPDCLDLGCANGSATEYVPVLKAGYRGIKAGDPDATVTSGGISGVNLSWMTEMFRAGAGDFMDAVAFNPYQNPSKAPPSQPPTEGFLDRYRLTNVGEAHDLLTRFGYPDMPIWFTELGWSTGRVPRPRFDGVPRATQAERLTQAVDLIGERYPFVTNVFWFCLRDRDDSTVNENGFGLLEVDGTPKPAYAAFAAANAELDGRRSAARGSGGAG